MKTITTLDFTGKKALIRVDFNVPMDEHGRISDNTRIIAALPTIKYVLDHKGSVVLMSHLGRPKNGPEEHLSLAPIAKELEHLLFHPVKFINDCIGSLSLDITQNMEEGQIALLENLRFYPEEEEGDISFAKELSKHGDYYINDAFGTAHRAHASTALIAQFFQNAKCFGLLMANEIENIDKVLQHPVSPTTAIIGGAKVSSKIKIIEHLLDSVNQIIIGGGMAYTFIKAQGGKVGNSLVEEEYLTTALEILEKAKEKTVAIFLPVDTIIANQFANDANKNEVAIDAIPDGWMGLDIGEKSVHQFAYIIENSKTILWNGPMGVFEMNNFAVGTKEVAKSLVSASKKGAFSLVGGGDSVAAINQLGMADKVSYVSTGGGAMLEYLEGKILPGIQAIMD